VRPALPNVNGAVTEKLEASNQSAILSALEPLVHVAGWPLVVGRCMAV
jgi:hypothetical protein